MKTVFITWCFACSFKAYSQNNEELLNRLHEKVLEKEDYFQDQLFYQLYTASWAWYTKQGDCGEAVFMDLAQGLIKKMSVHGRCWIFTVISRRPS